MDHTLCLNTNSFPASSAEQASILFEDALQGVLELNTGGDRYTLYLDSIQQSGLDSFLLASEFTFGDYTDQLLNNQDMDLYLFLLELEDKSPALDYLEKEEKEIFDEVFNYSFYIPDQAIEFPDVLSLAYCLNATLLSINSSEVWSNENVSIARIGEGGQFIDEKLTLNHISSAEHGRVLFDQFQYVDIRDLSESNTLTNEFIDWYEEQTKENKIRIVEKYKLACERSFEGGEPLFKTLDHGLREIRFSAHSGGAIRILFKRLDADKQAVLIGFIKKSNTEGYAENMPKAFELFDILSN